MNVALRLLIFGFCFKGLRTQAIYHFEVLISELILPAWAWHYQQIATPTFSESLTFHASQGCLAKVIGFVKPYKDFI